MLCSVHEGRLRWWGSAWARLELLPPFSPTLCRTGRAPVPGQTSYSASLFGCIIAPPPPTPWDAANLALAPLTAVIGSLNSCLPWSAARRDPGGAAAAGGSGRQQDGSGGQEQEQQAADPEAQLQPGQEQQPRWWRQPSPPGCAGDGVPQLAQPPQLAALQQGSGEAPEWLRVLFARN